MWQRDKITKDNNDLLTGSGSFLLPTVKKATNDQLWRCLDRYLSFDEPLKRWHHLYNLTAKNLSPKSKGFYNWPLGAKDSCFFQSFGGQARRSCVLINTSLALADLERYQTCAFEEWWEGSVRGRQVDLSCFKGSMDALADVMDKLGYRELMPANFSEIGRWILEFGYSGLQAVWLARSLIVPFDWSVVTRNGPWLNDGRTYLLAECLKELATLGETTSLQLVKEAQAIFTKHVWQCRKQLVGSFLPQLVLIVEGTTEELLFPYFAMLLGVDFNARGVAVIPAGGANQVLKRYASLSKKVRIPIVVVLDKDATQQAVEIERILNGQDCLHIISVGEIEDVFEEKDFVFLINEHLRLHKWASPITCSDFSSQTSRIKQVTRLWRERGLGDFDKTGFAKTVVNTTYGTIPVPLEIREILQSVVQLTTPK